MMRTVPLGRSGLASAAQALGCMGMSEFYGVGDEAENQAVLARAVELGITHLDTSDLYGRGENERLLGRFLKGRAGGREGLLIATKFGILRDPDGPPGSTDDRTLDNSPAHARAACEASLRRLGIDCIDLHYLHRHDPAVPIEEVVGALADLVAEGKIRTIGLSEVSAGTLRRAHATHPIAALQSEYSLFARDVERDILPACRELGIGFMAYSPLGRGILAGRIASIDDLAPDDLRRSAPIYAPENLPANLALVDRVRALADRRGATPGQVALAWLHGKGVIPLPGTKRVRYLEENAAAADLALSAEEVAELEAAVSPDAVAGAGTWSTLRTGEPAR
jgi:aryl-alcohol dehydrogenase-like predicted oxidoreductase